MNPKNGEELKQLQEEAKRLATYIFSSTSQS